MRSVPHPTFPGSSVVGRREGSVQLGQDTSADRAVPAIAVGASLAVLLLVATLSQSASLAAVVAMSMLVAVPLAAAMLGGTADSD